jgi:hypothetical protein
MPSSRADGPATRSQTRHSGRNFQNPTSIIQLADAPLLLAKFSFVNRELWHEISTHIRPAFELPFSLLPVKSFEGESHVVFSMVIRAPVFGLFNGI